MITQKRVHNLTFTKFEGSLLTDLVRDIMEIKGHSVETSFRLYPRNTPEILLNLAKPIEGETANKTAVVKKAMIQGSRTKPARVWQPEHCHFLSIRFTSNGYYKFLGKSQKDFTNHFFDLEDVINERMENLIPKLQLAASPKRRFHIICQWLNGIIQKSENHSKLLSDYIISTLKRKPDLSVKQLVEMTGYTRKHLAERFKEEAGLTIKEYQKIYRIHRVRKEINKTDQISWARMSNKYGFYDQSHFIKDFKKYTGLTPTEYLRQQPSKSLAS